MPAQHHTRPLLTAFLIASLVIPGPLTGCVSAGLYKPQRSKTQREAASVHIAVLSVHTWRSMVEKLQPHFKLTEEEAKAAVIRDSRRTEEETTRAIGAKGVYNQNEDGALTPDVDPGLTVVGGTPALPVLPTYPYEGRSPSERPDANLEFNAAKDLYQEVQMINNYVRDAVIPSGHRAYVVRLQVTLLPARRHSPYDVEVRIGFFSPHSQYAEGPGTGPDGTPLRNIPDSRVTRLRDGDFLDAMEQGPTVLPLFATDNLEASFNARSAEDMLSLSALLTDASGGITKGLGFDAFSSAAQSQVYGRDLNALMTVGQLSENSLIVRMGAMQETTADHAMVPRNHHITVLLTVPEDAPAEIEVSMVTELRDTVTGKVLRGTTDEEIQDLYRRVLDDYALDLGPGLIEALRSATQRNRPKEFLGILTRAAGPDHSAVGSANALWMDLANLTAGSQYAGTRFQLKGHGPKAAVLSDYFYDQTPILKDDGFTSSEVTISGIKLLQNVRPEAMLTIETDVGEVKRIGRWVQPPDDVVPGELTFQFESPAMMGLVREDGTVGPISLELMLKEGETYPFSDLLYQATGGVPN